MWFSWKWICGSLEKQRMKWMTDDNIEEVMPDSNGTVGSVKLWIGKSNCGDQNQILERPVPKIILLAKKQVLVNSSMEEPNSWWFYHFGGPVVDARSQKRHQNGVHGIYDRELVLNFKSCMSNTVITFNWLIWIKVWQTRFLSHIIIPLLWDNYLVLTNSLLYLRKTKWNKCFGIFQSCCFDIKNEVP